MAYSKLIATAVQSPWSGSRLVHEYVPDPTKLFAKRSPSGTGRSHVPEFLIKTRLVRQDAIFLPGLVQDFTDLPLRAWRRDAVQSQGAPYTTAEMGSFLERAFTVTRSYRKVPQEDGSFDTELVGYVIAWKIDIPNFGSPMYFVRLAVVHDTYQGWGVGWQQQQQLETLINSEAPSGERTLLTGAFINPRAAGALYRRDRILSPRFSGAGDVPPEWVQPLKELKEQITPDEVAYAPKKGVLFRYTQDRPGLSWSSREAMPDDRSGDVNNAFIRALFDNGQHNGNAILVLWSSA